MLSLGLGLSRSSRIPPALLVDVSEDTPATDFFQDYSVQGDLTYTTDESISGVSGNDFLKIVYPTTPLQTGVNSDISGITNKMKFINPAALRVGYHWKMTFDIYFETIGDWTTGADNTEITLSTAFGNKTLQYTTAADTVLSVDTGNQLVSAVNDRFFLYFDTAGDIPNAGATFYIRNFTLKVGKTLESIS